MQLTVAELGRVVAEEEHAPEGVVSIPLVGLVNGIVISGALWAAFIWTVSHIVG